MGRQAGTGGEEVTAGVVMDLVTDRHRMGEAATALPVEALTVRVPVEEEDMDRGLVAEADTVLVVATVETECGVDGRRLPVTREVDRMIADPRHQMHMEITRRAGKLLPPRQAVHTT